MKTIIYIHSFVDLITNSSTELFIIDKDKGLEMVKEIINEAIQKYPPIYDFYGGVNVHVDNPYHYTGQYFENETEDMIKYLTLKGYEIKAPEEEKEPEAIIISWERGNMSQEFIDYISEIFDVEVHDC